MRRSLAKHVFVSDGWRWTVADADKTSLIEETLSDLRRPEGECFTVIKSNPVRTVLSRTDSCPLIVKQYRVRSPAEALKHIVVPSKAAAEYRGSRLCATRRIVAPHVLAWGEKRRGPFLREACAIETRFDDAVQLGGYLHDRFNTATAEHKAELMRATGSLLARIHRAGLSHKDFHPGNILVRSKQPGDPQLYVVDLHSVRPLRLLRSRRRARDLAKLYHSLGFRTRQEDLKEMLGGYFATAAPFRIPESTILRLARRLETIRLRSRTKRCVKESSLFTTERVNGLAVRKRRDWPTEELFSVLRAHEEAKLLHDARLVKESRRGCVTVVQGSDERYSPRFVVKEPRLGVSIRRSRKTANVMRMRRAWLAANAFRVRGLLVPEHLALAEKTFFGVPHRAWLISRYLEDSQDFDRFLESHPNAPGEFFAQLAETVSTLFGYGIYHGDLSGKNVLIKEIGHRQWRFYFLDLESVILRRKLTTRRKRKNMGQLYRSIRRWCDACQREYFSSEMSSLVDVTDIPDI